jgi:hypothetical protein
VSAAINAFSPPDDDGGDVQEVLEREFQRRHQDAGPGVSDYRALRVDVERRQAVRDPALLARGPAGIQRGQLFAAHHRAETKGFEHATIGSQRGVRGRPEHQLWRDHARIATDQLRRQIAQADQRAGAGRIRHERSLRHAPLMCPRRGELVQ